MRWAGFTVAFHCMNSSPGATGIGNGHPDPTVAFAEGRILPRDSYQKTGLCQSGAVRWRPSGFASESTPTTNCDIDQWNGLDAAQ